jgi:thiamine kinase-like enzyme
MTGTRTANGSAIETRQLRAALERGLAKRFLTTWQITELRRRPSPYRTSFALEELKVRLADGSKLDLLFKNCSHQALSSEAASAKPAFLIDPKRELEVYQKWLEQADLGTAILYAPLVDDARGVFGLVLEHVRGRELYQIGRFDLWQEAARWLARFHAHFVGADSTTAAERLLRHDTKQCRTWLDHADRTIEKSDVAPANVAVWKSIAAAYVATIDRLVSLPATLIHGEFFASNVLLDNSKQDLRVCPIDWEMAAIGPGLLDLAALISGSWSEEQKAALAEAYLHELQTTNFAVWDTKKQFWFDLVICRLHLAVQRIGWSSDWTPPPEHRHDWWAEATQLTQRIAT